MTPDRIDSTDRSGAGPLAAWRLAFALWAVMAGIAGVRAQELATAEEVLPGQFGQTVDVEVINLEVVVTDRQGNPVSGLTPEDFQLEVDGEPVAIDYFSEVKDGRLRPGESAAAGVPGLDEGAEVRTNYLVFLDDAFTLTRDRNRVIDHLIADLGYLGPADRMAVVAFDGKKVEMLSSWSGSAAGLTDALRAASRRPTFGLQRRLERGQLDVNTFFHMAGAIEEDPTVFLAGQDPGSDADLAFGRRLSPAERNYLARVGGQLDTTVSAAAATLRAFAAPPGRKVMLVVSGGWPLYPAASAIGEDRLVWLFEGVRDSDVLYRPLVDTANRLGYTLYAVDAPGMEAGARTSAEDSTASQARLRASVANAHEWSAESTLRFLANTTGGRAFINGRRESALQLAFEDTRSYYWMGFTPAGRGNNERHRVNLRTRDRRLEVRTRTDYLDLSPQAEATMAVESTLLFGHPAGSGELEVEVGKPQIGGRRMQVPLQIRIPVGELTTVPQGDAQVQQLELRIAVQDARGDRADIPVIPLVLRFEDVPEPNAISTYETQVEMRRRPHEVVVSIHDPISQRMISTTLHVSP